MHDVTIAAEIGSKILPVGGYDITEHDGDGDGDGPNYTAQSVTSRVKKTTSGGSPLKTSNPPSPSNTRDSNVKNSKSSKTSNNATTSSSVSSPVQQMKLQIWDTAGQEHFRAVTRSYFRNAAGCLLVYDVTRRQTFVNTKEWLQDLRNQAPEDIVICLVGNKSDLAELEGNQRQVSYEEAEQWASDNGIKHFVETSAKTGENVVQAYQQVANNIYDNIRRGQLAQGVKTNNATAANSRIVSLSKKTISKQGCC